jgi:hypothetical protein
MALIAKKLTAKKTMARSPKPNPEPGDYVLSVNQKLPDTAGNVNLGNIVYSVNRTPAGSDGNVNIDRVIVDAPDDPVVFESLAAYDALVSTGFINNIYRGQYRMQLPFGGHQASNHTTTFIANPSNCIFDVDYNQYSMNTAIFNLSAPYVIFRNLFTTGTVFNNMGISQSNYVVFDGFTFKAMGRYDATFRLAAGMTLKVLDTNDIGGTSTACFADVPPGAMLILDTPPGEMPNPANFLTAQYPFAKNGGTVLFTKCTASDYPLTKNADGVRPFVSPGTRVIMADGVEVGVDADPLVDQTTISIADNSTIHVNLDNESLVVQNVPRIVNGVRIPATPVIAAAIGDGKRRHVAETVSSLADAVVYINQLPERIDNDIEITIQNTIPKDETAVGLELPRFFHGDGSLSLIAVSPLVCHHITIACNIPVYMSFICPQWNYNKPHDDTGIIKIGDNASQSILAPSRIRVKMDNLVPIDVNKITDPSDEDQWSSRISATITGNDTIANLIPYDYDDFAGMFPNIAPGVQAALSFYVSDFAKCYNRRYVASIAYGGEVRKGYISCTDGGILSTRGDFSPQLDNCSIKANTGGYWECGVYGETVRYNQDIEVPDA